MHQDKSMAFRLQRKDDHRYQSEVAKPEMYI